MADEELDDAEGEEKKKPPLCDMKTRVLMMNIIGMALMIVTILANAINPSSGSVIDPRYSQYFTMYACVLFLTAGHTVSIISVVMEVPITIIKIALELLACGIVFWILITIISLAGTKLVPLYMWVCIAGRNCPETVWLLDLPYRYIGDECPIKGLEFSFKPDDSLADSSFRGCDVGKSKLRGYSIGAAVVYAVFIVATFFIVRSFKKSMEQKSEEEIEAEGL